LRLESDARSKIFIRKFCYQKPLYLAHGVWNSNGPAEAPRERRVFKTENVYLGWAVYFIEPHDRVWVLAGAKVPFGLRKTVESDRTHRFGWRGLLVRIHAGWRYQQNRRFEWKTACVILMSGPVWTGEAKDYVGSMSQG